MANLAPEIQFKDILASIKANLKPLGYFKRRNSFRQSGPETVGLIEFQKSQWNNREQICFTINVCVFSKQVCNNRDIDWNTAASQHAQLRKRIGFIGNDNLDKWWELDSDTPVTIVEKDVLKHVLERAVPFISRYDTDGKLLKVI